MTPILLDLSMSSMASVLRFTVECMTLYSDIGIWNRIRVEESWRPREALDFTPTSLWWTCPPSFDSKSFNTSPWSQSVSPPNLGHSSEKNISSPPPSQPSHIETTSTVSSPSPTIPVTNLRSVTGHQPWRDQQIPRPPYHLFPPILATPRRLELLQPPGSLDRILRWILLRPRDPILRISKAQEFDSNWGYISDLSFWGCVAKGNMENTVYEIVTTSLDDWEAYGGFACGA